MSFGGWPRALLSPDEPKADEATGGGIPSSPDADTPAGPPKFDRVAYMRRYMREYRTKKRLEKAEKSDGKHR